jgi:hypothetical protein
LFNLLIPRSHKSPQASGNAYFPGCIRRTLIAGLTAGWRNRGGTASVAVRTSAVAPLAALLPTGINAYDM